MHRHGAIVDTQSMSLSWKYLITYAPLVHKTVTSECGEMGRYENPNVHDIYSRTVYHRYLPARTSPPAVSVSSATRG